MNAPQCRAWSILRGVRMQTVARWSRQRMPTGWFRTGLEPSACTLQGLQHQEKSFPPRGREAAYGRNGLSAGRPCGRKGAARG